jgi:hypothetical protein
MALMLAEKILKVTPNPPEFDERAVLLTASLSLGA